MPKYSESDGADTVDQIKAAIASMLSLDLDSIDEKDGLARYGLDSVSRVELLTSLSEHHGCDLPLSLLTGGSSIRALACMIDESRRLPNSDHVALRGAVPVDRIRKDALLPGDFVPPRQGWGGRVGTVLLTGATGFLGIHLLATLLRSSDYEICCLVRCGDEHAGLDRIVDQLRRHRLDLSMVRNRVRVFCGDLSQTRFGVADSRYHWLSANVDLIYHCGAAVDWTAGYEDLRASNVLPILSVLRFAQEVKAKPLHFLSSLGVCYSTSGPAVVGESDAMMKNIDGIHVGYFQTKVVAETLLFEARARGFPVTIYRPSLITGCSETGICNHQDLVSRMITGCIYMGAAPDLDWEFDCCPVDFVAAAITRLSMTADSPGQVYHLRHPHARHWREVVLCMNACGYQVRLVPYRAWLDRLESEARQCNHPLYSLQSFFSHRVPGIGGLTMPELYELDRRHKVDSANSDTAIADCELSYPPLEPQLIESYIHAFADAGLVTDCRRPAAHPARLSRARKPATPATLVRKILRARGFYCDDVTIKRARSEASIISDLTAWQSGVDAGLFRCHARIDGRGHGSGSSLDLFLKVKSRDTFALAAGASVSALCGDGLHRAYRDHSEKTGLVGTHERELWLYRQQHPGLIAHLPRVYGTMADSDAGIWALLMEDLTGRAWMDTKVTPGSWDDRRTEAVVDGLADIHAVWFDRVDELIDESAMGPIVHPGSYPDAVPFWKALARHAAPWMENWIGEPVEEIQSRLIDTMHTWCSELDTMRGTLIHNDCNPRNIAIRGPVRRERLCIFDWELATIGVPQRDCAEFLCFVLHDAVSASAVQALVDRHRVKLHQATGCRIDPCEWHRGFLLSLQNLMVNRIPLYLMVHRVKRQRYLPQVVRNWHRLYRQYTHPATGTTSFPGLARDFEQSGPSTGCETKCCMEKKQTR